MSYNNEGLMTEDEVRTIMSKRVNTEYLKKNTIDSKQIKKIEIIKRVQ